MATTKDVVREPNRYFLKYDDPVAAMDSDFRVVDANIANRVSVKDAIAIARRSSYLHKLSNSENIRKLEDLSDEDLLEEFMFCNFADVYEY